MARDLRILLFLVVVCLLVVLDLGPICAETGEGGEDAGVEEVEDAGEEGHSDEHVGGDENGFGEGLGDGEEGQDDEEDDDDGEQELLDEADVVVLGSSNFTAFVANQRTVLVAFHAPWCRHCQKLAPEWAAAATALKGHVAVAKVDATAHSDLSEQFHVNSYPTLLFFLDNMHSSYHGNRSKYVALLLWPISEMALWLVKFVFNLLLFLQGRYCELCA
jgi:protein disulfide-isomerase A1